MATICKQLKNLGASQCGFPIKVARRLIFTPLYDSDGLPNGIGVDDVKDLGAWTDLIYAPDPSVNDPDDPNAMLYPLPNMENVDDVRADTEFFEWNSGQKVRIRQGVRTFTGAIPNETPALLGKLQSWEGLDFGVYVFDVDGNLISTYDKDSSEYRPIPVDGESFDAKYMLPTYTDPLHIMLQYDYSADFNDKNIWLTPVDSLNFDGRTDLRGNIDVYGSTDTATADTIKLFLTMDYNVKAAGFKGGFIDAGPPPVTHYGDFRYWDESASAWVLVGTATDPIKFTETEDGVYYFEAGTVTPATGDYVVFMKDGYTSYTSEKYP